jgi:hypothetical protein
MKRVIVAALLIAANFLIGTPSVFAQEPFRLLTPAQTNAFHQCLHAVWVDDYCRNNTPWFFQNYGRSFMACVYANGGGKFPINGRTWYDAEDYCRSRAQSR